VEGSEGFCGGAPSVGAVLEPAGPIFSSSGQFCEASASDPSAPICGLAQLAFGRFAVGGLPARTGEKCKDREETGKQVDDSRSTRDFLKNYFTAMDLIRKIRDMNSATVARTPCRHPTEAGLRDRFRGLARKLPKHSRRLPCDLCGVVTLPAQNVSLSKLF